MKKLSTLSALLLSFLLLQSCTKDRVKNPDTLNIPQTTIFSESFDGSINLPAGWSSTVSGWSIDSVTTAGNNSAGYDGASGKNNVRVSNPSSGSGGDFNLISKSISTLKYNNITVTYAVRNSSHFSDNGSAISGFYYSIDNGVTWINIPYTENANNSTWSFINNAARMSLPADAANQASVKFKWDAKVVATPSGTYRIDDFQVLGTVQ